MNLRQRLDEIRTLEQKADKGKWEGVDYWVNSDFIDAMRNAIGPLLEVVEAQHRALEPLARFCRSLHNGADVHGIALPEAELKALVAARAALSLLDKEES